MPSRINMGPDGGPYIGINENNGNIELEDNTGTTVTIWDDANSQWDFQNNPISNVDSLTSNSVNTDELFSAPAGVRLQSSTQQTLGNNTVEQLTWDQASEYNTEADDFADLANDRIVIPNSEYSYARLKVSLRFLSSIKVNFVDTQKNGGLYDGRAFYQPQQAFKSVFLTSSWVPISQGDAFISRVRQESGADEDTHPESGDTWFSLEAI